MTPADILALPTMRDGMPDAENILYDSSLATAFGEDSIYDLTPRHMRFDGAAMLAVPRHEGIDIMVKMESEYINDWYRPGSVSVVAFRGVPFVILQEYGRDNPIRRFVLDPVTCAAAFGYVMSFMRIDTINGFVDDVMKVVSLDDDIPELSVFGGLYFDGTALNRDHLQHSSELSGSGWFMRRMVRAIHRKHGDASFSLEDPTDRRILADELAVVLREPDGDREYEVEIVDFIDPADGNWMALAVRAADGVMAVGMEGGMLSRASWRTIATGKQRPSRDDWNSYLVEIAPYRTVG